MSHKPIIIVAGQPNSIFFEIFFKSIKFKKFKSPLILVASIKLLKSQMYKFKVKKKIKLIEFDKIDKSKINNKSINIINVNLKKKESHKYIKNCFDIAFKILNSNVSNKLINGPINKSKFLNKKFLGITEYISYKFNQKKTAMLIYNKEISVCPITTHLPLKSVTKKISKKLIFEKTILINDFYKKNIGFKPKIAVTSLNPHCESISNFNEDKMIISPAIKLIRKSGYNINGPFSADTIFLKKNRTKYDVILGMYHDQVLSPFKTLFEYDAINITIGLPFVRVSPDHGPNEKMIGKNLSNPQSLIKAMDFFKNK